MIDGDIPVRSFPTLAARLAWYWHYPQLREKICAVHGTEQGLIQYTVRTLRNVFASRGKQVQLQDDYASMMELFRDALRDVRIFASIEKIHSLQPGNTIYDGIMLMADHDIRRVPIVDIEHALYGIFTVRDVIRVMAREAKYKFLYDESNDDLDVVLSSDVDSISISNPITLSADCSVYDAIKVMIDNDIGGLPIIENGKLSGIITERDVLFLAPLLSDLSERIVQVPSQKEVVTISAEAPIRDAIQIMAKGTVRRLPVLKNGLLAGIVTTTDIILANYYLTAPFSRVLDAPVSEIMTRDPYLIPSGQSMTEAINIMCRRNIGSLLIMDGSKLQGIVTERDIAKYAYDLIFSMT